ncbi:2-succinyl-5-enolpyruvyl-6-hydroxy-3-cyclohexene-1-carboxylic-acid synthase [Tenacibaculum sp. SZ-18]|uniref:2-succinyl-5-enolpyruvyl-6-hydroxy-3- cyclohexene-1-carboxylic-acid synthase n=1 Tax=Tenacibaculum sp. SZ-18 TaxID=754423 RepID=UPI000C2D0ADD|nr:2-succinyl-5-enolpyruvyl-6-hydroxy-3-cyclohexene-1-carboxylic-acid synthase [Tenacibaculum sp. SZ-18]AUC15638.1 2-succinyl-5-enolpyruvyl-6-hydroxy-3-cyclohexene-1-carboxylic-acid synthase [Tenacibaculum sp. SZ-18]
MYPKKQLAQLVISACQYYNIDKVVISPGSRNAPLTIGFSNVNQIETFSIVDERAAAFFALGIAQQTKKPVAIICTSGSALLNYYPAIAEAFYSKIPLLVISADRPKYLIDIGDGQTIRQENVFENHILYSANLVEDEKELITNKKEVVKALETCIHNSGPVHINVPFNEPIYETVDEMDSFQFSEEYIQENRKKIDFRSLSKIWNNTKRKLVLVGVHRKCEKTQKLIDKLNEDPSVLVMTETTSNLDYGKTINSIDKLISKLDESDFKELQPELLVTFGGMIVSKRIKQFLRKYQPSHHWHIDGIKEMNTYFCLSEFIQENPVRFFENFMKQVEKTASNYKEYWLSEKRSRNIKHKDFLATAEYSDLKVVESVLNKIPEGSQIQVSNSSLIRYLQLFDINSSYSVFCNRGTSGIDGSTSTAIGAACSVEESTTLLTGDLSFFYDSNALWNSYIPNNFRIIIINNSGGGIFKIIPGPKSTNALQYFETPHQLTANYLAKMFGFDYLHANSLNELNYNLVQFYNDSEKPKILEVFTPSEINDQILTAYFKSL